MSYPSGIIPRSNASDFLGSSSYQYKESFIHTGSFKQIISDTGSISTGSYTGSMIMTSGKVSCSQFLLTTTVYNEVFVPWSVMRITADQSFPDLAKYKDIDLVGGSTGSYIYLFDKDQVESAFFSLQLPHDFKEDTKIVPSVHWINVGADNVGVPIWGLEYGWQSVGGTFGNNIIVYATGSAAEVDVHKCDAFAQLASGVENIRSCLICRVFRGADLIADTLANDAALIGIGFIYQTDTVGSTTTTTK
jgi:hypothetical protein